MEDNEAAHSHYLSAGRPLAASTMASRACYPGRMPIELIGIAR